MPAAFGQDTADSKALDRQIQFFTGKVHPFATNAFFGPLGGYIPTNTVAFERYAMKAMLEHVNFLNEAWRLGIPASITIEAVTDFGAYPKTNGIIGGFTISNRFAFNFDNGKLERFLDLKFSSRALIPQQNLSDPEFMRAVEEKRRLAAQWAGSGKEISRRQALQMARDALHAVGCDERNLKLQGPILKQEKATVDGKERLLPLWEVRWYYNNDKDRGPVMMEISGMTTNIVRYFNLFERTLPMPDNYYDLLGLPDPRKNEKER